MMVVSSGQDTQPLAVRRAATRPNPALRVRGRGCGWLALIAATSCSLLLTVILLLQTVNTGSAARQALIDFDGVLWRVETRSDSVATLLDEQGIAPPPGAVISPPRAAALTDGLRIRIVSPRAVGISLNGDLQILQTTLENPLAILQSAGIALQSNDRVYVNGAFAQQAALAEWSVPAEDIAVQRAAALTIWDDGVASELQTVAATVGDALEAGGIALQPKDRVEPPLDSPLPGDLTIRIERAQPIVLEMDGVRVEAHTQAATVAGALAELDAPLFGLDYARPSADAPIQRGLQIEIVRVTETRVVESEAIPYRVSYQPNAGLPLDQRVVVQAGQPGRQEHYTRVRYENGLEVSRAADGSAVVLAPVNQVVEYGTQVVLQTVDTPAGARQYWRKLRMYATSYHPAALGGDSITAIGETLVKGIVAADPTIIPYRSALYVPGYGLGLMADTGGPRSSPYWIDLGYSDADWVSWSGYVDVYLLIPPPAEIDYLLPAWTPLRNRPDN